MGESIALLVIEDNPLLREGIAVLLGDQRDFEVATAASTMMALALMRDSKPQVVLLDSGLADLESLSALRSGPEGWPEARFIVMEVLPMQQEIVEFIRAGVSGFIAKDASVVEFIRTIRSVAAGGSVLPPHYTSTLFSHIAGRALNRGPQEMADAVRMTNREREVMELIGEGLSNKEIAQRLAISVQTVKSHVHNILEKLALRSRLQLAVYVRR
ncbi:MAG TPA: response regulator transcription factor [Gemmatimonadales bacterium]|nr:response regulator transcription factor [Gemmatimonadales bacterium]